MRGGIAQRAVLVATGLAAAPAQAAPAWLASQDLSVPGRDAEAPQVAIDAAGGAVAVWARFDGFDSIIQSSSRPPGGSWSRPVDLSAPGQDAEEPQVGVDAAGNAIAIWSRSNGLHTIVQAATRTAGGGWAPATDLSAGGLVHLGLRRDLRSLLDDVDTCRLSRSVDRAVLVQARLPVLPRQTKAARIDRERATAREPDQQHPQALSQLDRQ